MDMEEINTQLDVVTQSLYTSPAIALEHVRHILQSADIEIPTTLLSQTDGEEVFQVEDEDLFVYFGYFITEEMLYEIHAEVMDGSDLQDFLNADDEVEEEDE